MTSIGIFPFGQEVKEVAQTDRTRKRVFVLGVHASAVHARWVGLDNQTIANAFAVASEPCIFWRGDNAEAIIDGIPIPKEAGALVPANQHFNGTYGVALDDLILKPLKLSRSDAWLCDLVPHSLVNQNQQMAIERAYLPVAKKYGLPAPTVPSVPRVLADDERRKAIHAELQESGADILVLLGDKPIRWFPDPADTQWKWKKLEDFGEPYGQLHSAHINGKKMDILPLAHPRQIAGLGESSHIWRRLHRKWVVCPT